MQFAWGNGGQYILMIPALNSVVVIASNGVRVIHEVARVGDECSNLLNPGLLSTCIKSSKDGRDIALLCIGIVLSSKSKRA